MLRYILLILLITFNLNSFSQLNDFDKNSCDSTFEISKFGNIDYKLIFKQVFKYGDKDLLVIPHSMICKNNKSMILFGEHLNIEKVLNLDYDTCFVTKF